MSEMMATLNSLPFIPWHFLLNHLGFVLELGMAFIFFGIMFPLLEMILGLFAAAFVCALRGRFNALLALLAAWAMVYLLGTKAVSGNPLNGTLSAVGFVIVFLPLNFLYLRTLFPFGKEEMPAQEPLLHPATGIEFPLDLDGFLRTGFTDFSFDRNLTNVGVAYQGNLGPGIACKVTAYVYPIDPKIPRDISLETEFEQVITEVFRFHPVLGIRQKGDCDLEVSGVPLEARRADLLSVSTDGSGINLTGILLFQHFGWNVKFRYTFPLAAEGTEPPGFPDPNAPETDWTASPSLESNAKTTEAALEGKRGLDNLFQEIIRNMRPSPKNGD